MQIYRPQRFASPKAVANPEKDPFVPPLRRRSHAEELQLDSVLASQHQPAR
jgi:hypothetical protein